MSFCFKVVHRDENSTIYAADSKSGRWSVTTENGATEIGSLSAEVMKPSDSAESALKVALEVAEDDSILSIAIFPQDGDWRAVKQATWI